MEKRCHQNQDRAKSWKNQFSNTFEDWILNTNNLPHLNQVITWRTPNLTQKGGSKHRVHQGYGYIWKRYRFYILCFFCRIIFTNVKSHASCLIRIRWTSPNLIQKGGSKYRVHQGYGCVWRRYPFCTFCSFFAEKSCRQNQDRAKSWKNQFLNTFTLEFWIETGCHQNQDRSKT